MSITSPSGWLGNYPYVLGTPQAARPALYFAWVHYPTGGPSTPGAVIGHFPQGNRRLGRYVAGANAHRTQVLEGGAGINTLSDALVNQWVGIAASWISNVPWLREAWNGLSQRVTQATSASGYLEPDETRIGRDGTTGVYSAMQIAECSIWETTGLDQAGRDALVAALQAGANPVALNEDGPYAGMLRAYWRLLDETDLTDWSGNGWDLSMVGAVVEGASHPPVDPIPENEPPTAPGAFITPQAAEQIRGTVQVEWGPATDPDADPLQYEGDVSDDGGETWVSLFVLQAGLTYAWDTAPFPSGGAYQLRVRAFDGEEYGSYRESGIFTLLAPLTRAFSRFVFGPTGAETDFTLSLPFALWRHQVPTVGVHRRTAGGVVGNFVTRRLYHLVIPVRFFEDEWPTVRDLVAWGQTAAPFLWYPDSLGAENISVLLDAPQTGSVFAPDPDSTYPRVLVLPITLRRADGQPWNVRYFESGEE